MLCWCDIAQEGSSVSCSDCASDGCCDVIITRSNIGHKWSKYIEWCTLTDGLLDFHVGCDLVQRHMARTLNHNLYVFLPGTFCQLAQSNQLLNLGDIGGILQTSRTAGVTKAHGDIVFLADIKDLIVVLIERILLSCHFHPCEDDGTSAGNNVGQTFVAFETSCCFFVDTAVDCHKVNTVLGVHSYDIEPFLGSDFFQWFVVIHNGIINWHSTDDGRTLLRQAFAEGTCITVGTQVHNGFCTHFYRVVYFFDFHIHVFPVSGNSKVYIDFCF